MHQYNLKKWVKEDWIRLSDKATEVQNGYMRIDNASDDTGNPLNSSRKVGFGSMRVHNHDDEGLQLGNYPFNFENTLLFTDSKSNTPLYT